MLGFEARFCALYTLLGQGSEYRSHRSDTGYPDAIALIQRPPFFELGTPVILNAPGTQVVVRATSEASEVPRCTTDHFLHLDDYTKEELWALLKRAAEVKAIIKSGDQSFKPLAGKTMAMVFTKPSMRTRVSFETVTILATPSPLHHRIQNPREWHPSVSA